jgi:hypothetical protein
MHFNQAEAKCVQDGAHLASIHSDKENEFVASNKFMYKARGWPHLPHICGASLVFSHLQRYILRMKTCVRASFRWPPQSKLSLFVNKGTSVLKIPEFI